MALPSASRMDFADMMLSVEGLTGRSKLLTVSPSHCSSWSGHDVLVLRTEGSHPSLLTVFACRVSERTRRRRGGHGKGQEKGKGEGKGECKGLRWVLDLLWRWVPIGNRWDVRDNVKGDENAPKMVWTAMAFSHRCRPDVTASRHFFPFFPFFPSRFVGLNFGFRVQPLRGC